MTADGVVGGRSQVHEMCGNGAQPASPGVGRWCSIEIDFYLSTVPPAKLLKDGDQFVFIVDGIETQTKFGDQVMSIDQIRHE